MYPSDQTNPTSPETLLALKEQIDSVAGILATIERIHSGKTHANEKVTIAPVVSEISVDQRAYEQLHTQVLDTSKLVMWCGGIDSSEFTRSDFTLTA